MPEKEQIGGEEWRFPCPLCKAGLNEPLIKSLWARYCSTKRESRPGKKPLECPKCRAVLSGDQVKGLWHAWTNTRQMPAGTRTGVVWPKHREGFKNCQCIDCVMRRERKRADAIKARGETLRYVDSMDDLKRPFLGVSAHQQFRKYVKGTAGRVTKQAKRIPEGIFGRPSSS